MISFLSLILALGQTGGGDLDRDKSHSASQDELQIRAVCSSQTLSARHKPLEMMLARKLSARAAICCLSLSLSLAHCLASPCGSGRSCIPVPSQQDMSPPRLSKPPELAQGPSSIPDWLSPTPVLFSPERFLAFPRDSWLVLQQLHGPRGHVGVVPNCVLLPLEFPSPLALDSLLKVKFWT